MELLEITDRLSRKVSRLRFAEPVTHVYNPLVYARGAHESYLRRFGRKQGRTLLLGMNPGPWGMAQTGIPFGEVAHVRDWMEIDAEIKRPRQEHPKRPVQGLACARSEVSGARLWGWAKARFGTPEKFFARFFVANYCPLVFMEEGGRNSTPDKLPAAEAERLYRICDVALVETVACLAPVRVVGVGAFAEKRATLALSDSGVSIGRVLHPSPASPLANRGWAEQAEAQLREQGISLGRAR